ncbi:MAG: hypothetical protein E2O38_10455 [Proteobacteria bacterium]|nr:MAG: hypothetical protein E2O38_10455 [Pseudomonadota bacterium]
MMISSRAIGMQDLLIMLNLSRSKQCPLCDGWVHSESVGPELFTADHKGPVCTACATKRDPGSMAALAGAQAEYARYWADTHSLPNLYQLAIVADEWSHDGAVYAKAKLWLRRRCGLVHDYNFSALLHGDHTNELAQQHVLVDLFTGDEAAAVEAALRDQSLVGMALTKRPARLPLFEEYAACAGQGNEELRSGVYGFDFLETINAHCYFYRGGKPIAREYYATCTPEGELDTRWLGQRILTSEETTQLFTHWSRARETGSEQTLTVRRPPEITEDHDSDDVPF